MKIAISGSASCGKTSVIEELRKRGFKTFYDNARQVLNERKFYLPLKSEIEFRQNEIIKRQIKNEKSVKEEEIAFFDYGLIDTEVYTSHLLRKNPKIPTKYLKGYSKIFLLDRLPWINDGIRIESDEQEAIEIHNKIENRYRQLGYSPVKVPAFSVSERVKFILDALKQ